MPLDICNGVRDIPSNQLSKALIHRPSPAALKNTSLQDSGITLGTISIVHAPASAIDLSQQSYGYTGLYRKALLGRCNGVEYSRYLKRDHQH